MTDYARRCFKEDNPPFKVWWTEKIRRKKWVYKVREYSDYPIIFKQHKKKVKKASNFLVYDQDNNIISVDSVSSIQCRIFDLILDNKFIDGAKFFFDEIQAKYDSMEYKDFPDCIAHYCQAHRHFDNDIYISSQSQSRIIKRLVVLAEEYQDILEFRKLFGFGIVKIRKTWDMSANLENGLVNENLIDVQYVRKIFRLKKVGRMYDSKYLRYLQENANVYRSNFYPCMQLNKNQLLNSFFPSESEKKKLKEMRY